MGGELRQWMTHQTAMTMSAVANAATIFRIGVGSGAGIAGYSSTSVSIFSASSKSRSVSPPSLCVERRSRTLL